MRQPFNAIVLSPILLLVACGQKDQDEGGQPGVVTNIMDQALPDTDAPAPPANAIVPVEQAPPIETPAPAASPAGLIPVAIQGRWAGAQARCGDPSDALELTIEPDQLIFHESVGTVRSVDSQGGGRLQVQAAFTGEGESWTRMLNLRASADGETLTIVNDGTAVTRKRC